MHYEGTDEVDGSRAEIVCRKYREFTYHGRLQFTERVLFEGAFGGESVEYYECIEPHNGCTHAYVKLKDHHVATRELKWLVKLASGCTGRPCFHFAHFVGFQRHHSSHHVIFKGVTSKLSDYLRMGELDMTQKYQLCEDICSGLSFLHTFSPCVIHCAVTPESVLVCARGTAQLFNLSRAHYLQEGSRRHTISDSIHKVISKLFGGMPLKRWVAVMKQKLQFTSAEQFYLSPECKTTQMMDDKHDMFCLGVVIMEILTGASPNPIGPVGRDEIHHRRSHDIEALRRTHPPAVEVVECCLQQDPAQRSSVDNVLQQLQRAKETPKQTIRYPLKKELKPYNFTGFYQDKHYRAVHKQGRTDVCLLLNDKSQLQSALGPVGTAEDVLFLARVLSLNGGLPQDVLRGCDCFSVSTHDNVATFLGLIVEEHIHPQVYSVAYIFEEYAEVNMVDFFHHKSNWRLEADLFRITGQDETFSLVVRWSHQLFSAVSYLHQLGIKHNRLYGNCVRMRRRTSFMVMEVDDFDVMISYFLDNSDVSEDVKIHYESPESFEHGRSVLSWAADVWSVTCNIVLMITGQHPWEGVDSKEVPYKLRRLVNARSSGFKNSLICDLIHEGVLKDELHPYQFKAITALFWQVFLMGGDRRLQAKNIVDRFFHVCQGGSDMGQETVMLVVSEPPEFNITLFPIDIWTIPCCLCSPARQYNGNVVVSSDLPNKLARRGIFLQATATFVLYGSVLQQGGRSVGPAVFFHSPLAVESHDFHLRIPLYETKPCCDNCTVSPFIGAYDQDSLSYVFRSNQQSDLIHTYYDRNYLVIGLKDTAVFRPSRASEQADPFPCCRPVFEYEVRLYQSTSTELRREINVVVFIKSRLWEAVVKDQFDTACVMVKDAFLTTTWKQLDVEFSDSMQIQGQSHISQDDVNNIDSSPVRLQERVQDMRSYPPRVLLHGEDQCGWVRVRTNQMQILEYKWPNQDNRSKPATQIRPSTNALGLNSKPEESPLSKRVTDNPDHLMLFREHVSRKAASKGRAVLEGVGLDSSKIEACFNSNPLKEEEAVQTGLIRWSEGQGYKLPTWAALLDAMKYAKLAQQDIQDLEEKLTHKTAPRVISRSAHVWPRPSSRSLKRST